MINQRFSIIILLTVMTIAVTSVVFISGILSGSRPISNQGNVNSIGVGVYWENTCTNNVSAINWGYIEPGSSQNITIYVRNEGNVPMTLNMTTDNDSWNPASASTYITLSWNREGSQVSADSVIETVLTLSVLSSISDIASFSFDITIIGIE